MKFFDIKLPEIVKSVVIPLIICAQFFVVSVLSLDYISNTSDESMHLVRGIMLLKTGDYRLNQHHPILFNVLYSLPIVNNKDLVTEDINTSENWKYADKDQMGWQLIKLNGGDVIFSKGILYEARIFATAVTTICIFIFYQIIKKYFGFGVALISTILLAIDPNVITHGRLVTNDIPIMFMIFFTSFAQYLYFKNPDKIRYLILLIVLIALSLLTKYTAVFVAVLWIFLIFVFDYLNNNKKKYRFFRSLLTPLVSCIAIFVLVWGAYGFRTGTLTEMAYSNPEQEYQFAVRSYKLASLINNPDLGDNLVHAANTIPLPLPQYLFGFYDNVISHNNFGHSSYLLDIRSNGLPLVYFPIAFLFKEPIPVIAFTLIVFSILIYKLFKFVKDADFHEILSKKRAKIIQFKPEYVLVIVPLFYAAMTLTSKLNIGVRHFLPFYPFLFLITGIFISKLSAVNTYVKPLTAILLTTSYISVMSVYPNFLNYFNESIMGIENGYKIFRDSNFDWEQSKIYEYDFLQEYKDLKVTNNIYDIHGDGILIVSKKELLSSRESRNDRINKLFILYSRGQAKPLGEIGITEYVFYINEKELGKASWRNKNQQ